MKRSEVYREAARLVAEDKEEFSCVSISKVSNYEFGVRGAYEELMRPSPMDWGAWGACWGDPNNYERSRTTIKACRVLALCFMAAIAEAEEQS